MALDVKYGYEKNRKMCGYLMLATAVFGASQDPMARQAVQGSGHNVAFKVYSQDTRAPYSINGIYVDYRPSGRR